MSDFISRRSALRKITGITVLTAASLSSRLTAADQASGPKLKGRINHSVCKWCYGKIPLEEFCVVAKDIGLQSIDLIEVKDFPMLKKHGLICAWLATRSLMAWAASQKHGTASSITIRENHQYFGHYHTGGVPGSRRN